MTAPAVPLPRFECLLYGAVADADRERFIERLIAIGAVRSPLNEHEISCCSVQNVGRDLQSRLNNSNDMVLRLVCPLDGETELAADVWSRPWSVRHCFSSDADRRRPANTRQSGITGLKPTNVRASVNIAIDHGNAYDLVLAMGFCPEYEFVRRGIRLVVRNRIIISVFQLSRLEVPHDLSSEVPLSSPGAHSLVELCLYCQQDGINDTSDELRRFADLFHGLVEFYQVDHIKVLQHR